MQFLRERERKGGRKGKKFLGYSIGRREMRIRENKCFKNDIGWLPCFGAG